MIVMGRLVGPFGVRGSVRVAPYSEDPRTLLSQSRWWVEHDGQWLSHEVQEARMHGDSIVARIDGIASREDALSQRGAAIGVLREQLPALGEGQAYWADLVGLAVFNRRGVELGIVEELQDNGAHGLMRVRSAEGGERLIPLVAPILDSVDVAARRIVVDWESDW